MSRIDTRDSLSAAQAARQMSPAEAAGRTRPLATVTGIRHKTDPEFKAAPSKSAKLAALPRISATLADDLQPFSGMSRDRLIAGLARLEMALEDDLADETDPDRIAELDLGRRILAEQIRRLRLVQTSADALVAK